MAYGGGSDFSIASAKSSRSSVAQRRIVCARGARQSPVASRLSRSSSVTRATARSPSPAAATPAPQRPGREGESADHRHHERATAWSRPGRLPRRSARGGCGQASAGSAHRARAAPCRAPEPRRVAPRLPGRARSHSPSVVEAHESLAPLPCVTRARAHVAGRTPSPPRSWSSPAPGRRRTWSQFARLL